MPDSIDNQADPPAPSQPTLPPPAPLQPVAAPPAASGSSVLKIILIVIAVFVGLGIVAASMVGYGIYRVAHAVHRAEDGQLAINTPGGTFSANTTQSVSASDLGIAIYPGAAQGKGALHMTIAGKSMVTANYLTTDSKDQVIAFYKDKAGANAQSMMTENGGEFILNNGANSTTVTITPASGSESGKTQITIVHTSGGSSN